MTGVLVGRERTHQYTHRGEKGPCEERDRDWSDAATAEEPAGRHLPLEEMRKILP